MENVLAKALPRMLTGVALDEALSIFPEYDPNITDQDAATRLVALNDLYKVFVPTKMAKEIYTRMYLSLLRSLQKKETKLAIQQYNETHKAFQQQSYNGIINGADSFTIIGASGLGKSSAITRAIQLLSAEEIIEIKKPYTKIIPCLHIQTPFDSSIKSLLYEILRAVDEKLGSKYYENALRVKSTTDMLIGSVSQVALSHLGLLVVDEINHIVNHKNGKTLIGCLTQLINNSGISIAMIGTPESAAFFTQAMQLARRSLGLHYEALEFGEEFKGICETMYRYQYVKNRTELDFPTLQWLYEFSGGNISIVAGLIHDAQESAILDGTEILNMDTLRRAYQERYAMLHPYIKIKKPPQTSTPKKKQQLPQITNDIPDEDISVSTLILRAKNECREIITFLQNYITVEVIRI